MQDTLASIVEKNNNLNYLRLIDNKGSIFVCIHFVKMDLMVEVGFRVNEEEIKNIFWANYCYSEISTVNYMASKLMRSREIKEINFQVFKDEFDLLEQYLINKKVLVKKYLIK